MRQRNKNQITTGTMCIPKKEELTYFQKHRFKNEEKPTKDICLERGTLWQ